MSLATGSLVFPTLPPIKARWGSDGGLEGKIDENAFSRFAAKRLGHPRRRRSDGRPEAVPVMRRRSLTGIDSRARPKGGRRPCPLGDEGGLRASTAERGGSLSPKHAVNSVNSPWSIFSLERRPFKLGRFQGFPFPPSWGGWGWRRYERSCSR